MSEKPRVRVSGWGPYDQDNQTMSITLEGIPKSEREKVEGMEHGNYWMTVRDGRTEFSPTHTPLPGPADDDSMLPFWSPKSDKPQHFEKRVFDKGRLDGSSSPAFYVSHLCGYDYSPDGYKRNASLLESYGFACMRSRRGDNGKFWEHWYLPGTFLAAGDLKKTIEQATKKAAGKNFQVQTKAVTDAVISFLCGNVSFGTLDVVVQAAAMTIDGE